MPEYTDTRIDNFIINKLSSAKYEELKTQGALQPNQLYMVESTNLDGLNQRVINVAEPVSGTDAATKNYVDTHSSTLTPATTAELGGIIVGNNLSITSGGMLSADYQPEIIDVTGMIPGEITEELYNKIANNPRIIIKRNEYYYRRLYELHNTTAEDIIFSRYNNESLLFVVFQKYTYDGVPASYVMHLDESDYLCKPLRIYLSIDENTGIVDETLIEDASTFLNMCVFYRDDRYYFFSGYCEYYEDDTPIQIVTLTSREGNTEYRFDISYEWDEDSEDWVWRTTTEPIVTTIDGGGGPEIIVFYFEGDDEDEVPVSIAQRILANLNNVVLAYNDILYTFCKAILNPYDYSSIAVFEGLDATTGNFPALILRIPDLASLSGWTGERVSSVPFFTLGERDTISSLGYFSMANGMYVNAVGEYSHAEGSMTTSDGSYSHAEGHITTSDGSYSHAEGDGTLATGESSHAEGREAIAIGYASHAEGYCTTASGDYSHTEGYYTTTPISDTYAFAWNGDYGIYRTEHPYSSHGAGTFNINPISGVSGFFIGDDNLADIIDERGGGGGGTVVKIITWED